jgi:glycerophosphoryl diester phosphodiesterase
VPPLVIAHRGDSARRPENTRAAFTLAVEAGARLVELDVRLSSDGQVVVIHDATVDRTTDGSGEVAAMSLAEIRALSAGVRFDEEFRQERVPTLEETLALLKGWARVLIEIKSESLGGAARADLVKATATVVERSGTQSEVVFISFDAAALALSRQRLPSVPRGLLVYRDDASDAVHAAADLGCELLLPEKSLVNPSWVAMASSVGLGLATWVVDSLEEYEDAAQLGLMGVGTNNPSLLLEHLRSRG